MKTVKALIFILLLFVAAINIYGDVDYITGNNNEKILQGIDTLTRWPGPIPVDCPFGHSKELSGILFTGRHAEYPGADYFFTTWAKDGNLYTGCGDDKWPPHAGGFFEEEIPASTNRIRNPHFVDFGKEMEYSPDGYAYMTTHGSEGRKPAEWGNGDNVYLLRAKPASGPPNPPGSIYGACFREIIFDIR